MDTSWVDLVQSWLFTLWYNISTDTIKGAFSHHSPFFLSDLVTFRPLGGFSLGYKNLNRLLYHKYIRITSKNKSGTPHSLALCYIWVGEIGKLFYGFKNIKISPKYQFLDVRGIHIIGHLRNYKFKLNSRLIYRNFNSLNGRFENLLNPYDEHNNNCSKYYKSY